jgi:hypothetical protein
MAPIHIANCKLLAYERLIMASLGQQSDDKILANHIHDIMLSDQREH